MEDFIKENVKVKLDNSQNMSEIENIIGSLKKDDIYKKGYSDGYAKAINDFAELLLVKFCDESPIPNSNKWQADSIYTSESIKKIIIKIGSQLKKASTE